MSYFLHLYIVLTSIVNILHTCLTLNTMFMVNLQHWFNVSARRPPLQAKTLLICSHCCVFVIAKLVVHRCCPSYERAPRRNARNENVQNHKVRRNWFLTFCPSAAESRWNKITKAALDTCFFFFFLFFHNNIICMASKRPNFDGAFFHLTYVRVSDRLRRGFDIWIEWVLTFPSHARKTCNAVMQWAYVLMSNYKLQNAEISEYCWKFQIHLTPLDSAKIWVTCIIFKKENSPAIIINYEAFYDGAWAQLTC
jgi:hypothetical protein